MVQVHRGLRGQPRHVRDETDAYFAAHQTPGTPVKPGLGPRIRRHCLALAEPARFRADPRGAPVAAGGAGATGRVAAGG
ncbi:hypothetical protein ABZ953_25665 [Streptomyces sp. NPDC046465]|uniref:hypothetical protein n=1 Tax=Streptomyces sp. NPDC046465 TaxID=3155810 RepID=UPI0033D79EF4